MKIVCLSDQHGNLPSYMPDGDVLVIGGDVCPATDHSVGHQKWWLKNRFSTWLDFLPYKEIVGICGNHDWIFEKAPQMVPKMRWHYLENSCVVIDNVKFYGYPHTSYFNNWAFNCNRKMLAEAANAIPDDTDVLITHGPPYGVLDKVRDISPWGRHDENEHLGCNDLMKRVNGLPDLKLHVFGHIHSAKGNKKLDNTIFVNASYINEQYQHTNDYEPFVVEI